MRRCIQAPGTGLVLRRCGMGSIGMVSMMLMLVIMLEEEEEVESGGGAGEEEQEELLSSHFSPQHVRYTLPGRRKQHSQ